MADFLDVTSQWLQRVLGVDAAALQRVALSLAVLAILWLLRWLVLRLALRKQRDPLTRYNWHRGASYVTAALGVVLLARIWFGGLGSVATYLGLVSAGVLIALQGLLQDLVAWLYLVIRKPLEVGDRVEIRGIKGDVADIHFFQFTLMEVGNWVEAEHSTGRVVHLPNRLIWSEPLANYERGFPYIWCETAVPMALDADWRGAKALLLEIVQRAHAQWNTGVEQSATGANGRLLVYTPRFTPAVYTRVTQQGIVLTLRYLSRARARRDMEQAIWEAILEALALHPDMRLAWAPAIPTTTDREAS